MKYCKDCVYYRPGGYNTLNAQVEYAKCANPSVSTKSRVHPEYNLEYCDFSRVIGAACGPEGRHFVENKQPVKQKKSFWKFWG